MDKPSSTRPTPADQPRRVALRFTFPANIVQTYAQTVVVQHTDGEFIFSFHATYPPILLGTEAEQVEQRERIEDVEARCVGRVVMDPARAKQFLSALVSNIEKYERKHGAIEQPVQDSE